MLYGFSRLVQRIFHCDKIQNNCLTPAKVLNSLIYGTPFCIITDTGTCYKFAKMVRFLWPTQYIAKLKVHRSNIATQSTFACPLLCTFHMVPVSRIVEFKYKNTNAILIQNLLNTSAHCSSNHSCDLLLATVQL